GRAALRRGGEALERLATVDDRLAHDQRVGIEAFVVLERLLLRVRHRRLERLGDLLGRELLVELEDRVGLVHVLAANEVDHEPHLPGRLAHQPLNRMAAHGYSGLAFLSATILPLCPRNSRVGANSPSLCPTMFSVTYTGTNLFPLCTAKVWPTNSGRMVLARLQVLTTRFSFLLFRIWTLVASASWTKGPFLTLRAMFGSALSREPWVVGRGSWVGSQ